MSEIIELRSPHARRHADEARGLLIHYLTLGRPQADRDEVGEIVDHILKAAIEETSLAIATVAGLAVNAHVCAYHSREI